jgi:hypothetical protein
MPDCSATSITIGGRISNVEDFNTLLDAVTDDGAGIGWQYCVDRAELRQHLLDGDTEGFVCFSDNERAWGDWSVIVAACEKLRLHYCIEDDGCVGAWSPHRIYYHPETGSVEMAGGCEDHEPMFGLSTLTKWRDDGVLLDKIAERERLAIVPAFAIAPMILTQLVKDEGETTVRGFGR